MCIANIANQVEFLNLVSNEDQRDDKPTAEGAAELDAFIERQSKLNRAKLEMFPKIVGFLYGMKKGLEEWPEYLKPVAEPILSQLNPVVDRAIKLDRGELP